jgi:DNA (cytosine-5)-methyltransferase 1
MARSKKENLNFIDLFSGCGGLSVGLELAGHSCKLGVDFNSDAIETFKHNHKNSQSYCGDIQKLTSTKLKKLIDPIEIDMVVGGPPCQGFSTIGKGQAADQRNTLFKQFVRIVRICDPKILIMENVTGLLASKNKKTLEAIFREFEKQGYTMEARVLSSEEYGVPEIRRRTIIIGTKNCCAPIYPEVTHGKRGNLKISTVGDAFSELISSEGEILNHNVETATIKNELDRKRLAKIPEGKGIRYEKDELAYLPKKLRFDIDWATIPEKRFRQIKYQRLDTKLPSPTILTSRTSYYHPTENRYLTVREAASCQSFPPDFEFKGSLTSQFRQIGNAVPPLLGFALGLAAKQMVSQRRSKVLTASKKKFVKNAFNYQKQITA